MNLTFKNRSVLFVGVILSLVIANQPAKAQGPPTRILLQKTKRATHGMVVSALAASGSRFIRQIPELDVYVITMPGPATPSILRKLEKSGLFTFAEPDGTAKGGAVPNDPLFGSQWHLGTINAIAAWDISRGSSAVPIAMVDSGVNPNHQDLASKLIPGWSFLLGNTNTADVLGHGTATAGTAAAATDNGIGVAGIASLNPIMPLVVLNSADSASYSDIASAITYAADHGVRVINVSIGGVSPSSTLQSAVDYAWNKGAVVIASAMNNASSTPYYPAACDHVIAVSATEPGDSLAAFSNFGNWIDLSAPGDNILTTDNGGGYSTWYGTSFSSPIVAGTAALALSVNPRLTAQALVNILIQNADDVGPAGFDPGFGWGRVNAYRVVSAALASITADTVAPTVAITSPSANAAVTGAVQLSGTAYDASGVVKVELWIDGQLNSLCASNVFACSWNSAAATPGQHTVMIRAYDAAGNIGSASELLTVAVVLAADTTPPGVSIQSPLANTVVFGSVQVNVAASDNVGVSQLVFYVDGVRKGALTSQPWVFYWNSNKSGSGQHTLTVKAWDAASNSAVSSVAVTKR
jgi:thermitase